MNDISIGVLLVGQLATICVLIFFGLRVRRAFQRIHARHERLNALISEQGQEIQNAICLASLGQHFPIFLGGWSIDSFLAKRLLQLLMEEKPKTIVELGSGTSTIIIALCMKALDVKDYVHLVVDHEARYLDATRRLASLNHVDSSIQFLECPLEKLPQSDTLWYGGLPDVLEGHRIDLLLVDGPPGSIQKKSRYPALPMLRHLLSDQCTVILDDAVREDEQAIAKEWVRENPAFTLEILPGAHKGAILTRTRPAR